MYEILKSVWEEEQMPEEWKKSEIVPIYKQKGDPLECGNFMLHTHTSPFGRTHQPTNKHSI